MGGPTPSTEQVLPYMGIPRCPTEGYSWGVCSGGLKTIVKHRILGLGQTTLILSLSITVTQAKLCRFEGSRQLYHDRNRKIIRIFTKNRKIILNNCNLTLQGTYLPRKHVVF